jgi:hypothetical protein
MFVEDMSAFFSPSEFAIEATLDGVTVRGIFDNAFVASGYGMGMATTNPTMTMPTSQLPADPVGKPFIYGGLSYVVAEHHPDGTGMSVLMLERAA